MAKFDKAALLARLEEKRQKMLDDAAAQIVGNAAVWEKWHAADIKAAEKAIVTAQENLALLLTATFTQGNSAEHSSRYLNEQQAADYGLGHLWGKTGYGQQTFYRPIAYAKPVDTTQIDRAITEISMMVEETVSLTSRNYLNLL